MTTHETLVDVEHEGDASSDRILARIGQLTRTLRDSMRESAAQYLRPGEPIQAVIAAVIAAATETPTLPQMPLRDIVWPRLMACSTTIGVPTG